MNIYYFNDYVWCALLPLSSKKRDAILNICDANYAGGLFSGVYYSAANLKPLATCKVDKY